MIIEKKATQRGNDGTRARRNEGTRRTERRNEGTTVRGHEGTRTMGRGNDGTRVRRNEGTRTMERGNEKKDDDLIVNIIPRPQAWHYYRRCDLFGGNFLSP